MANYLPPVKYGTYINASPERVYAAISTGSGWDAWFTTRAVVDLEKMSYRFYWENFGGSRETVSQEGRIIDAECNRKFSIQWQRAKDGSWTVATFTLVPRASGTLVMAQEEGYLWDERDMRVALSCAGGWAEALTLLKFYLEHGITYGEVPSE